MLDLTAKPGRWTSRARHLERPGLSGDVAALREGEPDGRRGCAWCGLRGVGGVGGGGDRRVSLKSLWASRCTSLAGLDNDQGCLHVADVLLA